MNDAIKAGTSACPRSVRLPCRTARLDDGCRLVEGNRASCLAAGGETFDVRRKPARGRRRPASHRSRKRRGGTADIARHIRWLAGNYARRADPGAVPSRRRAVHERAAGSRGVRSREGRRGNRPRRARPPGPRGAGPCGRKRTGWSPPSANAFADRVQSYVESSELIAPFGFSYCLERMAVGRDDVFIRNVEAVRPWGRPCRFSRGTAWSVATRSRARAAGGLRGVGPRGARDGRTRRVRDRGNAGDAAVINEAMSDEEIGRRRGSRDRSGPSSVRPERSKDKNEHAELPCR